MNEAAEIIELKSRMDRIEAILGKGERNAKLPVALRVKAIQIEIAAAHHLTFDDMIRPCRQTEHVEPRHLAIYIAHKITAASTTQLGRLFHRDHSLILHAIDRVQTKMEADESFSEQVNYWLEQFHYQPPAINNQLSTTDAIPH